MDADNYNDGLRGGKIRVRARIAQVDKQTLIINEIPFSTTTSSLIDSILKANEKGKIKIKKIEDNTAADVEIKIHLPPNVSPDKTIDAWFVFHLRQARAGFGNAGSRPRAKQPQELEEVVRGGNEAVKIQVVLAHAAGLETTG